MPQPPRPPDLDAQRAAMKKLAFLAGSWAGEARLYRTPGEPVLLAQTEEAQFKLDGLILMIEGIGKTKTDGKPVIQALGILSYDDAAGAYRMRAFNDGRFLEAEVKLAEDGRGLSWGFTLGPIRTSSVLRVAGKGEWTELAEVAAGAQAPRKYLELRVDRLN